MPLSLDSNRSKSAPPPQKKKNRECVPVVDSCFRLGGVRRLQLDGDSDVDAGCNVKYFVCLRCQKCMQDVTKWGKKL